MKTQLFAILMLFADSIFGSKYFLNKSELDYLKKKKAKIKIGIVTMNLSISTKRKFEFSDLSVDNFHFYYKNKCKSKTNCKEVTDSNLKMKAIQIFLENMDRANHMLTTYPEWLFGPHNFFSFDQEIENIESYNLDLEKHKKKENESQKDSDLKNSHIMEYLELVDIEPILIHSKDNEIIEQMKRLNAVLFTGGGSYPYKNIDYPQFQFQYSDFFKSNKKAKKKKSNMTFKNKNNENIEKGFKKIKKFMNKEVEDAIIRQANVHLKHGGSPNSFFSNIFPNFK